METVRFTRPERVDFRLVRGPVPHVLEAFVLTEQPAGGTRLAYDGEIGADLWRAGQRWCDLVARQWEQTVAGSLATVKAEAERRASSQGDGGVGQPNTDGAVGDERGRGNRSRPQ